ncbi:MAG: ArsA family ATPase [Sedimentibacter sp.]
MGRIIIFTGKGGVGKTSVAAAHARHSALEGKRTLIVSTDMAHNLSDLFEITLGKTIQEVSQNLFALEIDPHYVMENEFQSIKESFVNLITSSGLAEKRIDQVTLFPGMDELFSLLKILDIYESGEYERIIVDCAPTGETLTLLKFPELLSWYIEKFFPVGKLAVRVLSPISKAVFKIQLPNKAALSDVEKIYLKMIQLQELFKDRAVTSARLVTMPEKMVIEETKRNYMYLNLYNFHVDGIFINRILPKDIDNPFFNEWLDIQNHYIQELEEVFAELPVYKIPWFDTDLNGISGIDKIEETVLSSLDVFKIHENIQGEVYEKIEEGYKLKLYLPCVQKGEINLHDSNTDVIVKIGNFKRNIPKPNSLRNYTIAGAKFEDNYLSITFLENK